MSKLQTKQQFFRDVSVAQNLDSLQTLWRLYRLRYLFVDKDGNMFLTLKERLRFLLAKESVANPTTAKTLAETCSFCAPWQSPRVADLLVETDVWRELDWREFTAVMASLMKNDQDMAGHVLVCSIDLFQWLSVFVFPVEITFDPGRSCTYHGVISCLLLGVVHFIAASRCWLLFVVLCSVSPSCYLRRRGPPAASSVTARCRCRRPLAPPRPSAPLPPPPSLFFYLLPSSFTRLTSSVVFHLLPVGLNV